MTSSIHSRAVFTYEDDTEHLQAVVERFMRGDLDDYPDVAPLPSPNTWETVISDRGNTAEAWETLIKDDEYSLPVFASIRNRRNMLEVGVDEEMIVGHLDLEAVRRTPLYPFRCYQAYTALQRKEIGRYSG